MLYPRTYTGLIYWLKSNRDVIMYSFFVTAVRRFGWRGRERTVVNFNPLCKNAENPFGDAFFPSLRPCSARPLSLYGFSHYFTYTATDIKLAIYQGAAGKRKKRVEEIDDGICEAVYELRSEKISCNDGEG